MNQFARYIIALMFVVTLSVLLLTISTSNAQLSIPAAVAEIQPHTASMTVDTRNEKCKELEARPNQEAATIESHDTQKPTISNAEKKGKSRKAQDPPPIDDPARGCSGFY